MNLKSKIILVWVVTYCLCITIANAADISKSFPLTMTFRAFDNLKLSDEAFSQRLEQQAPYDWIHAPGQMMKAIVVKKRWPNKIITIQEAYGGISQNDFPAVWPGHLLYKNRTVLSADISPQDEIIPMQDVLQLAKNNSIIEKVNSQFPFALTLYALDEEGNPDWSHAEHVILNGIENNGLIVQRGQWGSKPLAFTAGKAVVAAHMMFWTRQWQLNFSLHSPRGGIDNLTAQEWYARQIVKRVNEAKADGVEFDVGRWTWGFPAFNAMDANNDGVADYGYLDGVNSFGLGGQLFFRELRKLLGAEKIIQVDSNDAMFGVRGWKYINGVQIESFPAANDFDRFSEVFQHLRLWVENTETFPRFSYPFTKTPTTVFANAYLSDGGKTDFRFRVGFAAACLVGMPHPFASVENDNFDPANAKSDVEKSTEKFGVFNWDEYHGGNLNDWHWLGKPLNIAMQDLSDLDNTDLLAKTNWQWQVEKGFVAKNSEADKLFSADVQGIPAGILPKKMWSSVRLIPTGKQLPQLTAGREYTLEFEARGDDNWDYQGQNFDKVPRMISINTAMLSKSDKPLAVLVDSEWRTYKISFITDYETTSLPVFGVSEQIGKTQIRNIKLHLGGAERWSREFEKGLVLLNMTNHPWQVTVKKGYYRRLKGLQALEINNGLPVNQVVIPARDAVFLVKR